MNEFLSETELIIKIEKLIVEDINCHCDDTNYQSKSIRSLSKQLSAKYGKGFSKSNILI